VVLELPSPLAGPLGLVVAAVVVGAILVGVGQTAGVVATIFSLFAALVAVGVLLLRPTRITLGDEGIVRRWFGTRVLPYREIEDVVYSEGRPAELGFVRRSEVLPRLHISCRQGLGWFFVGRTVPDEDIRSLHEALNLRLAERKPTAHPDVAALTQGDRDVSSWRGDLSKLALSEGYRHAGASSEALVRVACDGLLDAPVRVAAVVALRTARDEATRAELAGARTETLHPYVRRAVDAWLASDDGELDLALEAVAQKRRSA
jgi:hypothetical protein